MTSIADDFSGSSLNPSWTSTLDAPTVSGGELSYPAIITVGFASLTHSAVVVGNSATTMILNLNEAPTTIGIGCSPATGVLLTDGFLEAQGGSLVSEIPIDTGLTGRYTLACVVLNGVVTANLTLDGDAVPTYTVSTPMDSTSQAEVAAGANPFIVLTPSANTYDDFTSSDAPAAAPTEPTHAPGLIFSITTLRYPDVAPVRLHRLTQYENGEVEIPLKDMLSAKVTISIYDPAVLDVLPLERFLHVRYLGQVVFWGPMTDPDIDLTNGTVTINALGPEFRLVKHFVRIGDVINGVAVTEEKDPPLPITSDGLWDLVVCGMNTDGQTTRGVPDLGISRGLEGDSGSTLTIESRRGDQVFGKIQQVGESLLGPDWDFKPQNDITASSYAVFNTYEKKGTDISDEVQFHYGWGLDNLDGCVLRPSGTSVVTHRHTVSADGENRGTAAAEDPSARFGPYVEWDAIEGNASDSVLAELGQGTVIAYGEPPTFIDVALKVSLDGVPSFKYGEDFDVGDVVEVCAHKGYVRKKMDARITKVTLSQTSSARSTLPSIELVPRILTAEDVGSGEGS